jgi:hypothetical protein
MLMIVAYFFFLHPDKTAHPDVSQTMKGKQLRMKVLKNSASTDGRSKFFYADAQSSAVILRPYQHMVQQYVHPGVIHMFDLSFLLSGIKVAGKDCVIYKCIVK